MFPAFSAFISITYSTWTYVFFFAIPFYTILLVVSYFFFFFKKILKGSQSFNSSSVAMQPLVSYFLFFIILIILPVLPLKGLEVSLWHSHFILNNQVISYLYLSIIFFILLVTLLLTPKQLNSPLVVDLLFILLLMLVWFFFLYASFNLFSVIFCIEILTLSIFTVGINLFLSLYKTSQIRMSGRFFNFNFVINSFYSALTFFWSSAIVSVLFFVFLLYFGWSYLTFDFFLFDVVSTFLSEAYGINIFSELLLYTFFFSLFFFKIGLPPFFIWKFTFFFNTSFTFIAFYVCFFFFFFFVYFIFLLDYILVLSSSVSWYSSSLFLLIGLMSFVSVALFSLSLKNFIVLSSSINSMLLIFIFQQAHVDVYSSYSLVLLLVYFIFYNLTLASFLFFINNSETGVSFFSLLRFLPYAKQNLIFVLFLSFAGLPPLSLFFFKFSIVSIIWTGHLSFMLPALVLLLFFTVFFYFSFIKNYMYHSAGKSFFKQTQTTASSNLLGFIEIILFVLIIAGSLVFSDIYLICINLMFS